MASDRSPLRATFALALLLSAATAFALTEEEVQQKFDSIDWKAGEADMGPATLTVPAGYLIAIGKDVETLMELNENPLSGREVGFVAPESFDWFAVFEYNRIGYVKDDDRDELDAGKILESLREGNESGNEERKRRGWSTLNLIGWERAPRYNPFTQNLEWAVRFESEGEPVVNHNTRLLGRRGVMEVALVCSPDQLDAVLPEFTALLDGYSFDQGEKYAEFKKGDKVAAVGLAALITGGAAVAATKTGFLAKAIKGFGKLIILAVAAIGTLFAKLFRKDKAA